MLSSIQKQLHENVKSVFLLEISSQWTAAWYSKHLTYGRNFIINCYYFKPLQYCILRNLFNNTLQWSAVQTLHIKRQSFKARLAATKLFWNQFTSSSPVFISYKYQIHYARGGNAWQPLNMQVSNNWHHTKPKTNMYSIVESSILLHIS